MVLYAAPAVGQDPGSAAQEATPVERARAILAESKVRDLASNLRQTFLAAVEGVGVAIPSEKKTALERSAAVHFSPDTLYALVEAEVAEAAASNATMAGGTLEWLRSEVYKEADRLVDEYQPSGTLQEYARGLQSAPPPEERVRAVARLLQAQSAGEFYVLYDEAITRAAFAALAALEVGAPAYQEPGSEELQAKAQQYVSSALVTFLYRYQPVSNEQLRVFAEGFESPAGQWYVQAYTAGVYEAILEAGRRVAAELSAA